MTGIERAGGRRAFTLIELLVVVAIISLLISVLLPALSTARAKARLSVCLSNLREIGAGIQAYALQFRDAVPRGPQEPIPYFPPQNWSDWATNQVWMGDRRRPTGIGALLARDMRQPEALFCPADDSNAQEELDKLDPPGDEDAYSSYLYRQLDQTTRDRLDYLGTNALGLDARALALDINSAGAGDLDRTNHLGRVVNILYVDGHAQTVDNRDGLFSLRPEDYFGFPVSVEERLNRIVVTADYAEGANPHHTPPMPSEP